MGKTIEVNVFASIAALIVLIVSCIEGGMLIQESHDAKKMIEIQTQVEEMIKLQDQNRQRLGRLIKSTRMDFELCQEQLNKFQAREVK
jgi:hypothetical protein